MKQFRMFLFSLPPVVLRRNHGGGKYVSAARADYSALMLLEALQQGWAPGNPFMGRLSVEVVWFQCGHGDVDNCLAGAKATLDALGNAPARAGAKMTYLGVYQDDAQIRRITVERERVMTKEEECLRVAIYVDKA